MKLWFVLAALMVAPAAQAETSWNADQLQKEMLDDLSDWILKAEKDKPKVSVVISHSVDDLRVNMYSLIAGFPKKKVLVVNPSVFFGRLQMFSLSQAEQRHPQARPMNLVAGFSELSLALWDKEEIRESLLRYLTHSDGPGEPISLIYVPLNLLLQDTPMVNNLLVGEVARTLQALNPERTRLMFLGSREQWSAVMAQRRYSNAFLSMEVEGSGLALVDFSRLFVAADCASTLQIFN